MKKKGLIIIIIIVLIALCSGGVFLIINKNNNFEIGTIRSEKELYRIYEGDEPSDLQEIGTRILTMPFSFLENFYYWNSRNYIYSSGYSQDIDRYTLDGTTAELAMNNGSSSATKTATTKDYSETNIQVENVDEADIVKTDGDYIYSLSENKVVITNANNPQELKIESEIKFSDGSAPVDLILNKDKLIVILEKSKYSSNTIVKIYNIGDKAKPQMVKSYELYEPYYTSRCIDNNLYVISSGYLREDNNKVERKYTENNQEYEIPLDDIKYLKDIKTSKQTLISEVDLNNINRKVDVQSYLIDISNAYVSEDGIYLLDYKYNWKYGDGIPISSIFGFKGIFGIIEEIENSYNYDSRYTTQIFKFDINKDGSISYRAKNEMDGKTINQYSLDEKDGNIRIALYDDEGARVVILDKDLKEIGKSDYVAKGEIMYSSRFMGDKAYLVTYRNMDPLFVIDLSNVRQPKVLGELHIPGYSTYLHPYDEDHLIGIGMETEEVTRRDTDGRVISTSSKVIGMKMALFDVSNVNNPVEIDNIVIGDRRTISAILTNPKALLFSKEKKLIAIPVNNYSEDFEVDESENYSGSIDLYRNYNKNYISEGYIIYNIDLKGFELKGLITHEDSNQLNYNGYYYTTKTKLMRGLYIDNNIYTISENEIKVNNLDNLELISNLKINKKGV